MTDKFLGMADKTSLPEWERIWVEEQANWQEPEGNSFLREHFKTALMKVRGLDDLSSLRVFVPLCGKTLDLLFFYKLGCTVVGVEYVKQPIDEFFKENNLKERPNTECVRATEDARLFVVQGDIFSMTKNDLPITEYDVIWDRGSFESIDVEDRYRYVALMNSVFTEDKGLYLVHSFQYDTNEHRGPPFPLSKEDLAKYFTRFSICEIATEDLMTKEALDNPKSFGSHFRGFGISEMSKTLYCMTLKELKDPENHPPEYWEERWSHNQIGFHESTGNKVLREKFPLLLKQVYGDNAPKNMSVFVPLCGKSQDIIYFYDKGFSVVGLEFASKAINDFFAENQSLSKKESGDPNVTSTVDGRIIMVQGDILAFNKENLPISEFDVIWDRGSFEAINVQDRVRYAELMMSLLKKPKGMHLLKVYEFDMREHGGPPNALFQCEIEKYYHKMSVERVNTRDIMAEQDQKSVSSEARKFRSFGISKMTRVMYLIQHKT